MTEQTGGSPSHLYSLAFCVHLIAYVTSLIAAFTPDWAKVTEIEAGVEVNYDKGPIISCGVPGGPTSCGFVENITKSSTESLVCFALVVAYIFVGFLVLQLLLAGVCVRSLRQRNLGIALLVHFLFLCLLVITCIVLFEASITKDQTTGNLYQDHTFGLSRQLLVVCALFYFVCCFFAYGEHLKRKDNNAIHQTNARHREMNSLPSHSSHQQSTPYAITKNAINNNNNKSGKFSKRENNPYPYHHDNQHRRNNPHYHQHYNTHSTSGDSIYTFGRK